jgi:uridylate kinase
MFSFSSSQKPVTVISLGGSTVVPEVPEGGFVKNFCDLIRERVKAGRRFVIVVGGGRTSRNYHKALQDAGNSNSDDNDWIGIYATHLNAELVRLALGPLAHPDIVKDPTKKVSWKSEVLVGGGWKPGRSTDYDAVLLAEMFGAKSLINVSNIDYVYTADPKKDPGAKPIEKISWADLIAMLPAEWSPNLSAPFDPIAARLAETQKLSVSIVNGSSLQNVSLALDGAAFKGTVITG